MNEISASHKKWLKSIVNGPCLALALIAAGGTAGLLFTFAPPCGPVCQGERQCRDLVNQYPGDEAGFIIAKSNHADPYVQQYCTWPSGELVLP